MFVSQAGERVGRFGRSLATWSWAATFCIRLSCMSIKSYIFSSCVSNILFTSDLIANCQQDTLTSQYWRQDVCAHIFSTSFPFWTSPISDDALSETPGMGIKRTTRSLESSLPKSSLMTLKPVLHIFFTSVVMVFGSRSMYGAAWSSRSSANCAKATSISTEPISSPRSRALIFAIDL